MTTESKSNNFPPRIYLGRNCSTGDMFKSASSGASDTQWQIKDFFQTITLPTCLSHIGFKAEFGLKGSVSIQTPGGDCQSPIITAIFNTYAPTHQESK